MSRPAPDWPWRIARLFFFAAAIIILASGIAWWRLGGGQRWLFATFMYDGCRCSQCLSHYCGPSGKTWIALPPIGPIDPGSVDPSSASARGMVLGFGLIAVGLAARLGLARELRRRGRCVRCLYDLAGLSGGRCPECGRDSRI